MSTGVDLMRPTPLPQPLLATLDAPKRVEKRDVTVTTLKNMTVTSLYAGGSGWAPVKKVGEVAWESAEYNATLEGEGFPEATYRYGADVAAGAASTMFALLLSALENRRPVDVAVLAPGEGQTPVILGVALASQ